MICVFCVIDCFACFYCGWFVWLFVVFYGLICLLWLLCFGLYLCCFGLYLFRLLALCCLCLDATTCLMVSLFVACVIMVWLFSGLMLPDVGWLFIV